MKKIILLSVIGIFSFYSCEHENTGISNANLDSDFEIRQFKNDFNILVKDINPNWTQKEKYDYVVAYLKKNDRSTEITFEEYQTLLENPAEFSKANKSSRTETDNGFTPLQNEIIERVKSHVSTSSNISDFEVKLDESKKILEDPQLSVDDKNLLSSFIEIFRVAVIEDYNYITSEGQGFTGDQNARLRASCGIGGSICVGVCTATITTLAFVTTGPGGAVLAAIGSFYLCKWCICCPSTKPSNVNCF